MGSRDQRCSKDLATGKWPPDNSELLSLKNGQRQTSVWFYCIEYEGIIRSRFVYDSYEYEWALVWRS